MLCIYCLFRASVIVTSLHFHQLCFQATPLHGAVEHMDLLFSNLEKPRRVCLSFKQNLKAIGSPRLKTNSSFVAAGEKWKNCARCLATKVSLRASPSFSVSLPLSHYPFFPLPLPYSCLLSPCLSDSLNFERTVEEAHFSIFLSLC